MWWRRLFRLDAMMIWLMRATEKEGDGTLAQANRRIINPFESGPQQEAAPGASRGTISSRSQTHESSTLQRLKMR